RLRGLQHPAKQRGSRASSGLPRPLPHHPQAKRRRRPRHRLEAEQTRKRSRTRSRDPRGPRERVTLMITIYTDGACSGNPGPGGWAWAIENGPFASGADPNTTNQRMELTAVLEAVKANPGPIEIVSDSTYVVNCFRDKWYEGWLKRSWTNSKREAVANRDLWEPLIRLVLARKDVTLR